MLKFVLIFAALFVAGYANLSDSLACTEEKLFVSQFSLVGITNLHCVRPHVYAFQSDKIYTTDPINGHYTRNETTNTYYAHYTGRKCPRSLCSRTVVTTLMPGQDDSSPIATPRFEIVLDDKCINEGLFRAHLTAQCWQIEKISDDTYACYGGSSISGWDGIDINGNRYTAPNGFCPNSNQNVTWNIPTTPRPTPPNNGLPLLDINMINRTMIAANRSCFFQDKFEGWLDEQNIVWESDADPDFDDIPPNYKIYLSTTNYVDGSVHADIFSSIKIGSGNTPYVALDWEKVDCRKYERKSRITYSYEEHVETSVKTDYNGATFPCIHGAMLVLIAAALL